VSSHHTNPGIVRGKASYMSPEQCLGDQVDLRTDVFALGIVLYELTTGRRCFQGNTDFERMLAVVRGDYVLPTTAVASYPNALEQVVRTALALDPAHRYPSAAAMIEALDRVSRGQGWSTGPTAISGLMRQLFGKVLEPWATRLEAAPAHGATSWDGPEMLPVPATVVITRPRRIARGTESDVYEKIEDKPDWQDEAPTRGRRSAPKLWCARLAA
jgi:serine/threonine protein kinase